MGADNVAARPADYESVWATLQEIANLHKETAERQLEWEAQRAREAAERQREWEEQKKISDASMEQLNAQISELSVNVGGVNNKLGKWAEALMNAMLWEKFSDLGYDFTQGGPRVIKIGKRVIAQIDMLLENGDYAMPVEIKSDVRKEDIDEHLERIEKVRAYFDGKGDNRILVGAIAGMVFADKLREYAMQQGLYVVVPSGDTTVIATTPAGWKVREWRAGS